MTIIQPNQELHSNILAHLIAKYQLNEQRDYEVEGGFHLSSLIYCLTKAYWDKFQYIPPTEKEVLMFSLGYGLQAEMTPAEAETPTITNSGVIYRPDLILNGKLGEMKTTRSKDGAEFPETWLEYMMAGCFMMDKDEYELAVLHIVSASLCCYTLSFTEDEMCDNWDYIMERLAIITDAMSKQEIPEPFQYCRDWECKNCRYRIWCEMTTADRKEEPEDGSINTDTD